MLKLICWIFQKPSSVLHWTICMKNRQIWILNGSFEMNLKRVEFLEWTATVSKHSLFALQFHHLPSDLARKGWCLLLIGEHIVSPLYNQWITKNPPKYFNIVMCRSTCQCIMYLSLSSSDFCCLFPILKLLSLSSTKFCFPFDNLKSVIYNILSIFIVLYWSLPYS